MIPAFIPQSSITSAVSALFSSGEQGVWYDPSDLTTLFQDSAGTTPVTAVEQPVGLMLDKSKGLVLGSELVTNGTFNTDLTGWSLGTSSGGTISWQTGGYMRVSRTSNTTSGIQAKSVVAGTWYKITGAATTVSGAATANLVVRNGADAQSSTVLAAATATSVAQSGTFTVYYLAASTTTVYLHCVLGTANGVFDFDNISMVTVAGNHATQSTSASRPVLSARVNLLNATATLATQSVTVTAGAHTLFFTGTGSITLSGAATGTYSAGTHSITTTAASLTLTVSGSVLTADLRRSNDGVGIPAYQRVTTSTDYDTAGFPLYLRTDGVDDGMATGSINFTGTDKMTMWVGTRKLTDSSTPSVIELSANAGTNNGAFSFFAPDQAPNPRLSWGSRGTVAQAATGLGYAAPITTVSTGIGDIAQPVVTLRVNSAQAATNTASQGTGTYGSYPLYIGRRGGTTLPFNGRIYGLIVRGAASSSGQIALAETYMNTKTKAY